MEGREVFAGLPKSRGAGDPVEWPGGGDCPVDPAQPISVWRGRYWVGLHRADRHDWRRPCVYRTRTPKSELKKPLRRTVAESEQLVVKFLRKLADNRLRAGDRAGWYIAGFAANAINRGDHLP
jgi:hypothetical protein